jgi:hypothetical protein
MSKKYCKAYYLRDLRAYPDWPEQGEEGAGSSDDEVVYLWDDFTVVKSPVLPDSVLFEQVTPEWKDFCTAVLQFEIPEDLRYAYKDEEQKEPLHG